MTEFFEKYVLDIISLFIAFTAYLLIRPYTNIWVQRWLSQIKLALRVRKVGVQPTTSDNYDDGEENASIGLNTNGPAFGDNATFNFIGEKFPEMIEEMHSLLLKAGIRNENAMQEFMKSKFTSGIALFFIIYLVLATNDFGIPEHLAFLLAIIGGILGGHRLTDLNMIMLANKRKDAIEHGIPDLVDLLVICTESGLDLNKSIQRIAREMRTSNPILADELSLTAIEMEMIPDHRQVFTNLENRTDCLEIKTISKTLSQALEYGSSLSASLKDLAVESREKRMLMAEGKAAQAPTLLTLPLMFFIMPCLFIVMLGPVILSVVGSFSSSN